MNAQTAIEIALRCGLVPAVAAMGVFVAISWLWPADVARRYRAGVAFALAVFIGTVLLPETKTLAPQQFYEWIPYLGILAAFVAGLTRAVGVTRGERWSAIYLFSAIGAWLVVPQWQELMPPWPVQWVLLATGVIVLTALLVPLPQLLYGTALPWWLMLATAATSIAIFDRAGQTFGRLAALPAGALAGCGIAALFAREPVDCRSVLLPYAIVVGGYAFTGHVYPTTPVRLILLLPLMPLALWICGRGQLARLIGARAITVQAICVVVPLALAIGMLIATGGGAQ